MTIIEFLADNYFIIISILLVIGSILIRIFDEKSPHYGIFEDKIIINDVLYNAEIPNYAIKSIKTLDEMPKVELKGAEEGTMRKLKGFFWTKMEDGTKKRTALYYDNYRKGPFIEIQTVSELFYINQKAPELTMELYNEMIHNVKLVRESALVDYKVLTAHRGRTKLIIGLVIIVIIGLLPIFFK